MPEYLSVEAYIPCPDDTLQILLDQFRHFLKRLGCADEAVARWLTQIAWEPDGSGFGSSFGLSVELPKVVVNTHPLLAVPIVEGWTKNSIPDLHEAWVSFTLAFETGTSRQNLDTVSSFNLDYSQKHVYLPSVGRAIWQVMHRFASLYPSSLVYFTNEAESGTSWSALISGQKDLWAFEAALIPSPLVASFSPIPDRFARIVLPDGTGFARTSRWAVLPWEE